MVGETEGTGIVHIAPGCGKEDFSLGQKEELPPIAPPPPPILKQPTPIAIGYNPAPSGMTLPSFLPASNPKPEAGNRGE